MGIEEAIRDFLGFLRRPVSRPQGLPLDVPTMISLFLILFVVELLLFMPIAALLGLHELPHSMSELMERLNLWKVMLIAVLLAPILEELIFRLQLGYRYMSTIFIFCSAIFLGWLMATLGGYDTMFLNLNLPFYQIGVLGSLLLLSLFVMLRYSHDYFADYGIIFYLTAVVFGLAHVTNFEIPSGKAIFAPLMVLPQIILALYLGYVRLKRGLLSAIFLHAFNNAIPFALILMTDLGMNQ